MSTLEWEASMLKTKISWFGIFCWLSVVVYGPCASAVSVADVRDEVDRGFYSYCAYYVKPATCLSHGECQWVGSCVPR